MPGAWPPRAAPEPLYARRRGRRSWSQRVMLTVGCVVVTVCLAGASVAAYAIVSWGSLERVDNIHVTPAAPGKPMNILLVGSDSRAREGSQAAEDVQGQRSDTMMVMRIDPATDRVNVLSLPRDLMVPIADTGRVAQLNSAYSAPDKRQVFIDTIQQDFGIQINHWVEVDFEGFRQLVNGIGGVTLYFPYPIRDRQAQILFSRTGCVKLDGNAALAYSRIRHGEYQTAGTWHHDPLSDLRRIHPQPVMMAKALRTAPGQPQPAAAAQRRHDRHQERRPAQDDEPRRRAQPGRQVQEVQHRQVRHRDAADPARARQRQPAGRRRPQGGAGAQPVPGPRPR